MTTAKKNKVVILLSEKDVFLVKIYKYKFNKEAGWETMVADDPKSLLELVLKEKPSLVLTDIILKNGTAYDVIEKITHNKDKKIASIPIVILTDLAQNQDVQNMKKLGVTEYLVKSETTFDEVISEVKQLQK